MIRMIYCYITNDIQISSFLYSLIFVLLETQNSLLMLLRALAQQHTQEFENAVMSLPDEQKNKMTMAVTQS